MHGSDVRCRKANCIVVEDKTDLPDPAKLFSHRKELSSVNHFIKRELLTNHVPVPGDLFAHAALWLTVASGALSQLWIFADIWLLLTKSKRILITVMSSWILLLSLSCITSIAIQRLTRISPMSSSSFCKGLCQNGYVARRPATLTTALISFAVALLTFWHSPCSSWMSLSQLLIDF